MPTAEKPASPEKSKPLFTGLLYRLPMLPSCPKCTHSSCCIHKLFNTKARPPSWCVNRQAQGFANCAAVANEQAPSSNTHIGVHMHSMPLVVLQLTCSHNTALPAEGSYRQENTKYKEAPVGPKQQRRRQGKSQVHNHGINVRLLDRMHGKKHVPTCAFKQVWSCHIKLLGCHAASLEVYI